MVKVTISDDVELETLIRTPNKNGKHAELIDDPKQNSGIQVEAKVPKEEGVVQGVYIIKLEAEMVKVTISGDVELETLIRTPNKNGKHAELIDDPKQNSGIQVEAKVPKRRRGGAKLTHFVCEKIGVKGEHARVTEFIRKGSGDECHDVFVLEADIYSIVKKDVKKEEDIDINIFKEDDNCTAEQPCKLVAQFVKKLCKLVAQSMKQPCKLVAQLCMLGVSKMLAMKL
nr:heavy metal-associated isoprenylated plant protein 33-like [Ipomoea batatas]